MNSWLEATKVFVYQHYIAKQKQRQSGEKYYGEDINRMGFILHLILILKFSFGVTVTRAVQHFGYIWEEHLGAEWNM